MTRDLLEEDRAEPDDPLQGYSPDETTSTTDTGCPACGMDCQAAADEAL